MPLLLLASVIGLLTYIITNSAVTAALWALGTLGVFFLVWAVIVGLVVVLGTRLARRW